MGLVHLAPALRTVDGLRLMSGRHRRARPQPPPGLTVRPGRRRRPRNRRGIHSAPAVAGRRPVPRGRARIVAAVLVAASLLTIGAGAVARPAWQTREHLLAAARLSHQLSQQVERGRVEEARDTLSALQERTQAARTTTTGLGWRLGHRVPGLAANLTAVRAVALAMDDLAHEALPGLVEVAGDLNPAALAPRDGQVELAALQRAKPRVVDLDEAVQRARDRLTGIRTGGLLPPLREAVAGLRQVLDRAAAATRTAVRAATLVPPMLGASDPRTYLVLFQNPTEIRATGGIAGAFLVVQADRGMLRIIDQGTAAADLRVFTRPVLPLEPELRDLYSKRLGIYPANVNLTPHFPTAAELAREMYRRRSGRTVDGVLATDPVALSYLLRATGPVELPDAESLTADNVVRVLLSEVYATAVPNAAQDEYFGTAARAAFDALIEGRAEPRAAIGGIARAAGERRTLLWSANPAEQRLLAGTVLAGELPTDDGLLPTVGVFLNDGGGAKLGYYLTQEAQLSVAGCRADGRRELRLRVTLGSTAPTEGLTGSVLGLGLAGDPYTIRTNLSIFSPADGELVDVRRDGAPASVGTGTERHRVVGVLTVDLPPGARVTVEATLLTGELPTDRAISTDLWVTPAVAPWEKKVHSAAVCGS